LSNFPPLRNFLSKLFIPNHLSARRFIRFSCNHPVLRTPLQWRGIGKLKIHKPMFIQSLRSSFQLLANLPVHFYFVGYALVLRYNLSLFFDGGNRKLHSTKIFPFKTSSHPAYCVKTSFSVKF